jgi:hypothetical protein
MDSTKLVKDFLGSLKAGPDGKIHPKQDLLSESVVLQTLGKFSGRHGVIDRMTGETWGPIYGGMAWDEPVMEGANVKIRGKTPPGSFMGGVIVIFKIEDGCIAAMFQQSLPGAPLPASEIKLTPELRAAVDNAFAANVPIVVAHVDDTGQPILNFRGSTQSFSDTQLAMWVRNSDGNFLKAIEKNPKVSLLYRNNETRTLYQFQGRARVSTDEAARQQVYERMAEVERMHDYARTGVVVIVDLDRVEGWAGVNVDVQVGRVRMLRGAGAK